MLHVLYAVSLEQILMLAVFSLSQAAHHVVTTYIYAIMLGRIYISTFEGSIVRTNECSNVHFTWFVHLIMKNSL